MTNAYVKPAAILTSLFILSIFSYVTFVMYRPKILSSIEIASVKGTQSGFKHVVLPDDSKEIGNTSTASGYQVVLKAPKSPQDMQVFYRNIYKSDGWKTEYETNANGFWNSKYKKNDTLVYIVATADGDAIRSIVTVTIEELN